MLYRFATKIFRSRIIVAIVIVDAHTMPSDLDNGGALVVREAFVGLAGWAGLRFVELHRRADVDGQVLGYCALMWGCGHDVVVGY